MSRVRSKTEPYSSSVTKNYGNNVYPYQTSDAYADCNVRFKSSMTDDISAGYWLMGKKQRLRGCEKRKSGRAHEFHACFHQKATSSLVIQNVTRRTGSNYSPPDSSPYTNVSENHNVSILPKNISYPSIPSIDWTSLTVDLANSVEGLVKSRSLLAVTLREASSTVRMIRNPFGLLKTSKRFKQIGPRATARELARSASNFWLEWNYGWKSALYDISNLADAYHKVRSTYPVSHSGELKQFAARSTTVGTPLSPSMSDASWNSYLAATMASYSIPATAYPFARVKYAAPRVTAVLSCKALIPVNNLARAFNRDAFALGLSAAQLTSTLWEVLPFSFVVDWFINTKAILALPSYLTAYNVLSGSGVLDLGYSVKAEYSFQGQIAPCLGLGWGLPGHRYTQNTFDGRPKPSCLDGQPGSISTYQRVLGLPSGFGPILDKRGLSLSQVSSALSLFFQRMR